MTASRPAQSASADLPVPARPPMLTIPTSGSRSRSRATRCSADRGQRAGAAGVQHQAGVTGEIAGGLAVKYAVLVQFLYIAAGDGKLRHARPAGIDWQLRPVLLSLEADGRRLDPQRQV